MTSSAYWNPFTPVGYRQEVGYRTIVSGEGMYVTDTNGQRALDGTAGLWCVNVGHGRSTIADAMAAQAKKLAYYHGFEYRTEPAIEVADTVASMAPGDLNHVFFTCSGSEAVDTAIKIVRGYRARRGEVGRTKIISRDKAYHGVNLGGTSLSGLTFMRTDFEPLLPHAIKISHNHCRHCPFDLKRETCQLQCAEQLEERIIQEGPETVSAFIMEPVYGAAGVIPPPDGYVKRIAQICEKYGVLLIFDEVITGFGRLGTWFAGHRFGVVPDMMTVAKGLTSAYAPLGAVVARKHIYETFVDRNAKPSPEFAHGFTYSGHPVSCAAAKANLAILQKEELPARAARMEGIFRKALEGLRDIEVVEEVRCIGTMAAVEYEPNFDARAVTDEAYGRGLIVRPVRNQTVLSPPLIMEEKHVEELVGILREAIVIAAGIIHNRRSGGDRRRDDRREYQAEAEAEK